MISLKKSVFMRQISLFFLINLTLFAAPLKVGVSSNFNVQLVNFIIKQDKTLDIELIKYQSDKNLNKDLLDKKIDVNIFQTLDNLNLYNNLNETNITSISESYIEPMGLYSKKYETIKNIKNKAIIAIPKGPSNKSRSLKILETLGLIKLDHTKQGITNKIISNPFKIEVVEIDNFLLPRFLEIADYVILSCEIALNVGYSPQIDSLFLEGFNKKYVNIIATRENMLKNKKIIRFSELIKSQETKLFILEKYGKNIKFL